MVSDTRLFTHPRVHADFDFDGIRGFDTSLRVRIPGPFSYYGRDVCHQQRRFELWSPNSSKTPVYPGTRPAGFSLVPPLTHRRTDGSGGRFDWTLIPQHLDRKVLHHPFILDPERVNHTQPEFTYLTAVWHSLPKPSTGRLDREFISRLCERAAMLEKSRLDAVSKLPPNLRDLATLVSDAPTQSEIQKFGDDLDWDTCVDDITHIQRLLREKAGWLRMMATLRSTDWIMGVPADRQGHIVPVTEGVLGAWINGGDEDVIQWFLRTGVPCYIIHEYRNGVDFGHGVSECRSRCSSTSFCPSDIWHLRDDVNAYETVAVRNHSPWSTEHPTPCGRNITASAEQLACSSSHYHGYSRRQIHIFQQPEPADEDIVWPSAVVFPDRIPWLRPPPIAVTNQKGPWLRFSVETLEVATHALNGRDVMQQRGKNFKGDGTLYGPFYDRKNKRQLYFESLSKVPGLVSDKAFGRPVPFYHFVDASRGKTGPKTIARSEWMYYSAEPTPSDIGKEPPLPLAAELAIYEPPIPPSDPYKKDDENEDEDDYGFYHPHIDVPASADPEDTYHSAVRPSASSGLPSMTITSTPKKMNTIPDTSSSNAAGKHHSASSVSTATIMTPSTVHTRNARPASGADAPPTNPSGLTPDPSSSGVVGTHDPASPKSMMTPLTTRTHSVRPASAANAHPTNPSSLTPDTSSSGMVGVHYPASPKSMTTIMTPSTARTHSARPASGANAPTNPSSLTDDISSSGVVGTHHSPKSMTTTMTLSIPCSRSARLASEVEEPPIMPSSPEHVSDNSDRLPKLMDVDPPLQTKKDVTSLFSTTQSLKPPSFVRVTPPDSYTSPTKTVAPSFSSLNNTAEIKFPQSNTSAVPPDGQCPMQVSTEHYETPPRATQADYQSSPARVGNRISGENVMHAWPDNEMPALETLCVVFRNLPVDTTIDDIAEKLRAPPREGGCGVSISSSAILPSSHCVSFVVGFESLHEAKIAMLGWDGLDLGHTMPAPQSLLSVLTLTPYRPHSAGTFVEQPNQNAIECGLHPQRSTPAYNHRMPIPAQPHRPVPYYVPSRVIDHPLDAHITRSPPGISPAPRFSLPGSSTRPSTRPTRPSTRPSRPSTRPMFHQNPGTFYAPGNSSRTRNATIPASQPGPPSAHAKARHDYDGYMRRKGHMPWQD